MAGIKTTANITAARLKKATKPTAVTDYGFIYHNTTDGYLHWVNELGDDFALRMTRAAAPGGRLTLTSGTPVTSGDVTAAGTLYYTPHTHNLITLYSGSATTKWMEFEFSEISLALTLTSGKNYDVFAFFDGDAVDIELSAAWASDTSRTDALARQDGIWVKSSDHQQRWIGTIRASASNQTEDSKAKRFVWNVYNQVLRPLYKAATTPSWVCDSESWRKANAATEQRIEWVLGARQAVEITQLATAELGQTAGYIYETYSGIGLDDDAAPVAGYTRARLDLLNVTEDHGIIVPMHTEHKGTVDEGFHYAQALETKGLVSTLDPIFQGDETAYISGLVMM